MSQGTPITPVDTSHGHLDDSPHRKCQICQLWSRGQQVLLLFKDEASMSQHAELWPSIPHWWANQVKHLDLVHYLEHMKSCSHPGKWRLHTGPLITRMS